MPERYRKGNCTCDLEWPLGFPLFNGPSNVAILRPQAAARLSRAKSGFQHDQGDGHALTGAIQGAFGCSFVNVGRVLENANSTVDELPVAGMDIDHEVPVDIAQPRHSARGQHVQDHLL